MLGLSVVVNNIDLEDHDHSIHHRASKMAEGRQIKLTFSNISNFNIYYRKRVDKLVDYN